MVEELQQEVFPPPPQPHFIRAQQKVGPKVVVGCREPPACHRCCCRPGSSLRRLPSRAQACLLSPALTCPIFRATGRAVLAAADRCVPRCGSAGAGATWRAALGGRDASRRPAALLCAHHRRGAADAGGGVLRHAAGEFEGWLRPAPAWCRFAAAAHSFPGNDDQFRATSKQVSYMAA